MSLVRRFVPLLALVLGLGTAVAVAGPQDTRVGETRMLYDKAGTVLRATAGATGAPVATLPANTPVQVLEVKLPWVRVSANGQEGWIKAYQAIEPAALSQAPPPASVDGTGAPGVSSRDVAAAGRQLDADTERGFRASRADLERAYLQVDELERMTARMDPAECLTFVMGGDIGRRGCDYQLPSRLPPTPDYAEGEAKKGPDVGGALKLGGELLGRFGKGKGAKVGEKVLTAAGAAVQGYYENLKKDFTPKQEYYYGRAVAANAIAKYRVDPDANRRAYVRHVGDAIVRVSSRLGPNYGGYHFEVLDSDEINGVSGPGGFVLLTRGAVEACQTEDQLAGILCHELAHVLAKHGEHTLRSGQGFQSSLGALGGIAGAVTDKADPKWTQGLVKFFGESVGEMSNTSVQHAYGKQFETDADRLGTDLLFDVFYDWGALRNFLRQLAMRPDAHGDSATHASPADRAATLDGVVTPYGPFPAGGGILEERRARFDTTLHRQTAPVSIPGPTPPAPTAPPTPAPGGLPPVPPPTPLPPTAPAR